MYTTHVTAYEPLCFLRISKKYPVDTLITCDNIAITHNGNVFHQTIIPYHVVGDSIILIMERNFKMPRKGIFHIKGQLNIHKPTYEYVPYVTRFSRTSDIHDYVTTRERLEKVTSEHKMYHIVEEIMKERHKWYGREHRVRSGQGYEFVFKLEVCGHTFDYDDEIEEDVTFERNYTRIIELGRLFPNVSYVKSITLNIPEDKCKLQLLHGKYTVCERNNIDFMLDINQYYTETHIFTAIIKQHRRETKGINLSMFSIYLRPTIENDEGYEELDDIELIIESPPPLQDDEFI